MANGTKTDLALLEDLKKLSNIPVCEFDTVIAKLMKRKDTAKLWWDNKMTKEWDGEKYRKTNYRCCPSSKKVTYMFCLLLDRNTDGITVLDAFLSEI